MGLTLLFISFFFFFLLLIWKAGRTYPIMYLFLFTYFIQYIFSTYLIYNEYKVLSYHMPLKQERYFEYVFIALIALFVPVFLFVKDFDLKSYLEKIDKREATRLGYLLVIISFVFDGLQVLGLPGIDSLVSFTFYLKYIGAFALLFGTSRFNFIIVIFVYLLLIAEVLRSGVFISFFIWATFLFFFVSLRYKFSFLVRGAFIMLAIPVVILVQSVKDEYRKATWDKNTQGGVGLFSDLAEKQNEQDIDQPFAQTKGVVSTVGRLTQGWHLSMVILRVPAKQPYVNGSEMMTDITASIVPRIFFPDKKVVNSQEKFYKYTGYRLYGSTSMSIGVLGDFYINFGRIASFVALFIFGWVIAKSFNFFVTRFVLHDPINVIWIPFILSYLIRANNDFYIFFNGAVKGFLIFLIINFLRHVFFGSYPAKMGVPKMTRP